MIFVSNILLLYINQSVIGIKRSSGEMVDPLKVKTLRKHLRQDCGAVLIFEEGVHWLMIFFEGKLHQMSVHPDIVFALYREHLVESHQGKWIRGRNWACGL